MARATFDYQRAVREVDKVLAENNAEIRADNWQQVALDWFTADERDRNELARYIAAHAGQLGVAWARDLVRLEVFFRANDHTAIITHYDRAMTRYPRCPLVEMWVAEQIGRHGGDWWRARPLLLYAVEQLPDYARPYYELGFMHYLLGDFPGALRWFDQAATRLTDDEAGIGARIFYNRGLVRYAVDGDRATAIADVEAALRLKPDYPQAEEALRGLRGRVRWVPW
jgi:tetratricopeptide (TPR) repeat protein